MREINYFKFRNQSIVAIFFGAAAKSCCIDFMLIIKLVCYQVKPYSYTHQDHSTVNLY